MTVTFYEIREKADAGWNELTSVRPWIRIGTALCGQAAGAEEVADAFEAELKVQGLDATVSRVGCLGLCYAEPLVDILVPGKGRVVYGNVTMLIRSRVWS